MKKFFSILLSDSNKYSTKRFIGVLCLAMFILYGLVGLFKAFDVHFWIFYVSLCVITIWIAFKFMTADKVLKYDVIGKLTKFAPMADAVSGFVSTENELDDNLQPDLNDMPVLDGPDPTSKPNLDTAPKPNDGAPMD
jgi:hypothetical protein